MTGRQADRATGIIPRNSLAWASVLYLDLCIAQSLTVVPRFCNTGGIVEKVHRPVFARLAAGAVGSLMREGVIRRATLGVRQRS
jgi:hypothetical protein